MRDGDGIFFDGTTSARQFVSIELAAPRAVVALRCGAVVVMVVMDLPSARPGAGARTPRRPRDEDLSC